MDNNLYAITASGAKKWSFPRDGNGNNNGGPTPAVGSDGTVYIGSITGSGNNGHFYAIQ